MSAKVFFSRLKSRTDISGVNFKETGASNKAKGTRQSKLCLAVNLIFICTEISFTA